MRRQVLLLRYEPQAAPPAGEPPAFDVKSGPGTVTLLEGDDSAVPAQVSYESRVTMTDETHFLEDGEISLDGGGLRSTSMSPGVMEPAAEHGVLRGAVAWRVEGSGRWEGVTGLVASAFEVRAESGVAVENQVVRLFLP